MKSQMADEPSRTTDPSQAAQHPGRVRIPGAKFRMGSEDFYREERPVHEVTVDGFWMDSHEVTNEQFARFVAETSYKTLAERPLNPADFPGAPAENLVPGSMLFQKTDGPVDLRNYANWWPGRRERVGAIRWGRNPRLRTAMPQATSISRELGLSTKVRCVFYVLRARCACIAQAFSTSRKPSIRVS
jgi:hypothetical protein